MAFKLPYQAKCEHCDTKTEKVYARSPTEANSLFVKQGWRTMGNSMEAKHYCPDCQKVTYR